MKLGWLRILLGGLVCLSCLPFVVSMVLGNRVLFEPSVLSCIWSNFKENMIGFNITVTSIYVLIPIAVTIISNIEIIRIVANRRRMSARDTHRSRTNQNRKTINTGTALTVICLALVATYFPIFGIEILKVNLDLPDSVNLIKIYSYSINSMINPAVFLFMNGKFRDYVKSFFCKDASTLDVTPDVVVNNSNNMSQHIL